MASYLDERIQGQKDLNREQIRSAVIQGATRRIRPALMTSATTILALLPILTVFVVPVLYCGVKELQMIKN